MRQQTAIWQADAERRLWLSMLIDAMEEAARPEIRSQPCPPAVLEGLRAQLAKPVCRYPFAA
ncbi:hypothetical protein [Bradyrhizobium sp. ARR65]|uniref:hypothetical protein n=1 Tax=Bradyrhizobium sp. ARR65 TaxID=1040989 RepID=UPI000463D688|nr:hypothetical protein [Bradyrhizobium sp. ARR65]